LWLQCRIFLSIIAKRLCIHVKHDNSNNSNNGEEKKKIK
jgi:hypothetical protein